MLFSFSLSLEMRRSDDEAGGENPFRRTAADLLSLLLPQRRGAARGRNGAAESRNGVFSNTQTGNEHKNERDTRKLFLVLHHLFVRIYIESVIHVT